MTSTLLLALAMVGTVHAEDDVAVEDAAAPTEAPAEDAPAEDAPAEDAPAEDAGEDPVEIFDDVPEAPPVEAAPVEAEAGGENVLGLGYRDGYSQGQSDAGLAGNYGLHGLAGFAGGCVIGPCGCVAVPALEAVISPSVPNGGWQAYSPEYQRGYIDGYRREVQKKRVIYSLAGASLGTVVGVGAGIALGAAVF